jgi:hypothetical protein
MKSVTLNSTEIEILYRQHPITEHDGGFQKLLVDLQSAVDRNTGALALSDEHEEKISRYAFDYKNGGWEDRLKSIFERTLGPELGR